MIRLCQEVLMRRCIIAMKVVEKPETFVRVNQYQYLSDSLRQQRALVAQVADSVDKAEGTSSGIDYSNPPKNFAKAMSREDAGEWMEAYRKEYQGFKDRDAVRMVIPPRGAKVLRSTNRVEYKVEQGVLQKRKVRLCARGDQRVCGVDDSYSPVLKATVVRFMTAIAAEHGCNI